MLRHAFDEITADHLHQLVENGVEESRTLEFKADYGQRNGRSRTFDNEQKKELLADVSSFANTGGGDLLFGIKEEAGKAVDVVGLDLADPDAEKLKIESILRDNLEPPISGITIRSIGLDNGHVVIVVRIPRSWIAPHRVKPNSRFFARHSSGKYAMDVTELRQAFTFSEAISERIKRFRLDRLAMIERGETPFPLLAGPLVVIHIVPLVSFTAPPEIAFGTNEAGISPPGTSTQSRHIRYSLEGFVSTGGSVNDKGDHASYGLLFRNGIIEAVDYLGHYSKQTSFVYASEIEETLCYSVPGYLERLATENIEGPYYILVSLIRLAGYRLNYGQHDTIREPRNHAPSPNVLLPDRAITGTYEIQDARKLSDLIHNAFGLKQSHGFIEEDGKLKLRR
ncbi:ATP-binding protein [Mesorhizobium sp. STM 4661]|uniref:AlbA family DNA-binding domain-containing protein n=1 Tax=Mesorhizobium sp. STM 4661 TaxID=1297570 RepID=UPI0002BED398|nr:ATP-binding protein [Mesorhizobium sp. STM 4661]CCV13288.1 putative transcriptional regulator [Mesorhizobium sp. STM 4661]